MSGGTGGMDIRLPMGLMFAIIGGIIAIFGMTNPAQSMSLDININLIWGSVMAAFGVVMLLLAFRARKA
jgi:hypothetical protein